MYDERIRSDFQSVLMYKTLQDYLNIPEQINKQENIKIKYRYDRNYIYILFRKIYKNTFIFKLPYELNIIINEYINVQYDLNIQICLEKYNPCWIYFLKDNTIHYNNLDQIINKKNNTKDKLLEIYKQFNKDFI